MIGLAQLLEVLGRIEALLERIADSLEGEQVITFDEGDE